MTPDLTDIAIREIDGYHVVEMRDWRARLGDRGARRVGRPLRHERPNLWIMTSDAQDARRIARDASRRFLDDWSEGCGPSVTTKRQPTFQALVERAPEDVAIYFSATSRVDDQSLLERLHPATSRASERLTWWSGEYRLRSYVGSHGASIDPSPKRFAERLAQARKELRDAAGPGCDETGAGASASASPVLAAILETLTRPAAECVSHWMTGLGEGSDDELTIPPLGFRPGLSIEALHLERRGVSRRVGFRLHVGDLHMTDHLLEGMDLPDTAAVALGDMAGRGDLLLSAIVDLPGADRVRVTGIRRAYRAWTADLDASGVAIDPPTSDAAFDPGEEIERISRQGNDVAADAAYLLGRIGRERAEFALYCVENGSSGMSFDVSAWTPPGLGMRILLRDGIFSLSGTTTVTPATAVGRSG